MSEISSIFGISPIALAALLIWVMLWKGAALWVAARSNEKWWFVIMLIVNTLGILEAAYLFLVKKGKWPKEVKVDEVR